MCFPDHAQNTYRVSADGSLRVTFASGMELTLNTEPHISAGVVNPTVGKCNITLPGEHSPSLIEWRQRREQAKGNYTAFERRLRVIISYQQLCETHTRRVNTEKNKDCGTVIQIEIYILTYAPCTFTVISSECSTH